jgi:(p)ppGpp synthase/HD superfamily hydrolase
VKTLVQKAKDFATTAHAGQFRRDGVTPYIGHPAKVAGLLAGHHEHVVATAWLHDVIEDTSVTAPHLEEAGFPRQVVEAVAFLTRASGNDYQLYLDKLRRDPIARAVKVADMLANLTDAPTPRQVEKYTKAILLIATS